MSGNDKQKPVAWLYEAEGFADAFSKRRIPLNAMRGHIKETALYAAPQEKKDWVRVPREATPEMLFAAGPAFRLIYDWCAEMQQVRGRKVNWPADDPPLKQAWRLMISAAPASPSLPEQEKE